VLVINFILTTNRLFRDVSAWYHIVVAVDTTQSTANDRVKFYVNGVQETSFATQTMGSQNADLSLNSINSNSLYWSRIYIRF
jgi:ethanolamine utilization microcompartment shell protein EutL